jgi:hypothetical protein
VNATLQQYAATRGVGAAFHVRPENVDHVAHDENSDWYSTNIGTEIARRVIPEGRNAWIDSYRTNYENGRLTLDVELIEGGISSAQDIWRIVNTGNIVQDVMGIRERTPDAMSRLDRKLYIHIKSRADYSYLKDYNPSERKAIDTLHEMISERDFRKYLTHGFILVPGRSGKMYQIFRSRPHTRVWSQGKMVEEVCVVIQDEGIPKTDKVIALKVMLETDEEEFRKMGNIYKMDLNEICQAA